MSATVVKFSPEQVAAAANEAADPAAIVKDALDRLPTNKGAMYEDAVIEALKTIRRKSETEYLRLVTDARGCKTQLDRLTKNEGSSQTDSNLDLILSVAQSAATFAHDSEGKTIALVNTGEHQEAHLLNSPSFDRWLRGQVYAAYKIGIPEQAMRTALATLAAVGTYEGHEITTYTRCARHGDDYFIDMCDEQWRILRVSASGHQMLNQPTAYFTRFPGMRALPTLDGSADIDLLWKHVNIPPDAHTLVLTWLLDSLRPDTPYPVLELCGEMGSSKSTTQKRLRALIDPHDVPLRSRPKTIEDIHIAAANAHVVSFENLSSLTPEQQDALCILSTGGGYATRQLYTNGAEHVIQSKRPVILNGINTVATRPDLIERAVSIELPTIAADERKDEQCLEADWEKDYPRIFGGFMALFSRALAILPSVQIGKGMQKRMLDFQKLGEAVCIARGGQPGDFSSRLDQMHGDGVIRGLESYGVAGAIQMLLDRPSLPQKSKGTKAANWEGTCLQLLNALNGQQEIDRSNWPRSPRHLAGQLSRIAPGMRQIGIRIEQGRRSNKGAIIRIFQA